MDQSRGAINSSGQKGSVFVVRRHDDTEFLENAKIFRKCQRHSRTATRIRSVSHGILLEFRHIRDARIFDAPQLLAKPLDVPEECRLAIDFPSIYAVCRKRNARMR